VKRFIVFLVVSLCCMLITSLAWAGEGERFDGVTLRAAFIGGGDYERLYEEAIPKFEEATGARVDIVFRAHHFDLDKKLKVDYAADAIDYDVFSSHTSFYSQYIDFTEPLDEYFTEEELEDFLPMVLNFCRRDGSLWTIPRHADISALHYRTDLFEDPELQEAFEAEYGYPLAVPETWDQFEDIAIFFSDPPVLYGTQFAGTEEPLSGRFKEIMTAHGGQIIDEDYRPAFHGPEGIKAATMLRNLYQVGAMPPGMVTFLWDDVAGNWVSGIIAMYTEWYGWYSYFQDPEASVVAGKFGLARQPQGDAGIHSGWAGAHTFSVTRTSQNKEAAAAFVKYLTDFESQLFEAEIGYIPIRDSVFETIIEAAQDEDDPLDLHRLELMQLQMSKDFTTPPLLPEWFEISTALFPRLQAIMLGDIEVEAGLNEAAREVEEIMSDAGYY